MKFSLGQTLKTRGISEFMEENRVDPVELIKLIERHVTGDWGDIPEEDKKENDWSVENAGRLISSYTLSGETVWVITEADRSATTVLFPSEY